MPNKLFWSLNSIHDVNPSEFKLDLSTRFQLNMHSGRRKDDYTLERMLERRYRNNIRKVLGCNGRRLTAREIDIVNICTRHSDQRYTLFTYDCESNRIGLSPYILPQVPVPVHHQLPDCTQQQALGSSSDSGRSSSPSVVAPFLFQMNAVGNAENSLIDSQPISESPSTSRVTLPCYLLSDKPEALSSSGIAFNSTVNLIADTIIESRKSGSDKECSEKDSSDKGNDEKGICDKSNSKKISRKNSKKKKKNRKKGGAMAGPSESQVNSDHKSSDEPCISSNFSSSTRNEISLVDGDGCGERVKSDTEALHRCFSSNSSDRCLADVSGSNSMVSGDEGEGIELALPETVGPAEDAANEYPTTFGEKDKADDFIPVVSGKRGRYGRRLGQQVSNPSQLAALRGLNGYQFSARPLKPSKIVSGDQSALHFQYSKKWDSRAGTSVPHESSVRVDTTHKSDTVFKKDDFPSLPLPCSGQKEVVRGKVGQRSPLRDNWNIPPVPLPRTVPEQCKEPESEAAVDTNDESQAGNGISAQVDKSCTAVAQCDTSPSNFSSNVPRDVDASRSGSSVYSSPASTTPMSHSANLPAEGNRDLRVVSRAVQAADRLYQMIKLVQNTLGGPLADYELLCHHAAPSVSLQHLQIAEVPLRKIWQWYEEPSSYSLEVRGCHDHHHLVDFTAHFVPSLSAVQLLVQRGNSESAPGLEDVVDEGEGSPELVYEFFEFDQPHLRPPLFEKLKELIGGVTQGRSYFLGDAHKLERLCIGDLHPASWYCVAWYPSYRLPEGKSSFKAAFLTFHSLAHFVQDAVGSSTNGDTAIASFPVVGLMSYKTKMESWYKERCQGGDIMGERLESLKLTAMVMARARIMKGGQMLVNHHPDFEFFASMQSSN